MMGGNIVTECYQLDDVGLLQNREYPDIGIVIVTIIGHMMIAMSHFGIRPRVSTQPTTALDGL